MFTSRVMIWIDLASEQSFLSLAPTNCQWSQWFSRCLTRVSSPSNHLPGRCQISGIWLPGVERANVHLKCDDVNKALRGICRSFVYSRQVAFVLAATPKVCECNVIWLKSSIACVFNIVACACNLIIPCRNRAREQSQAQWVEYALASTSVFVCQAKISHRYRRPSHKTIEQSRKTHQQSTLLSHT